MKVESGFSKIAEAAMAGALVSSINFPEILKVCVNAILQMNKRNKGRYNLRIGNRRAISVKD